MKTDFSSPVASAEFSKFAGILSCWHFNSINFYDLVYVYISISLVNIHHLTVKHFFFFAIRTFKTYSLKNFLETFHRKTGKNGRGLSGLAPEDWGRGHFQVRSEQSAESQK